MIFLKFQFSAIECNGWPKLRFIIDDDIHLEHEFTSNTESVPLLFDIEHGKHVLQIERYGKKDNNIILDGQTIVRDQIVELQDIFLEDIKLPDYVKYSGSFRYSGRVEPSSMYWGPNGVFELDFETPFVDWIINQQKQKQNVIDLFNYSKKASLEKKILEFEKILNHD